MRQKEVQIIRVEDTENMINMNLAGIVPNFNGQAKSADINQVYYQLRSFRYANLF